jgi:hypothetical protein
MRNLLRSWWRPALSRRRGPLPLRLERLENRIVFALPSTPLPFTAFGTAHAAAFLSTPNDFQLYQVHLGGGDVVTASVSSQASGGALHSSLRVFDATGRPLALDAQEGGDPHLTFQAPVAGDYLVGVSSAGDDAFNPAIANSGHGGATTGLFDLDLQRKPAAPLTPELAGGRSVCRRTRRRMATRCRGHSRWTTGAGPLREPSRCRWCCLRTTGSAHRRRC